jgi:hypothetical protein
MNGVNKRQAVLEVLREAGEPISVTDCAAKFAVKLGIPSGPAILSDIAHRLSAVLTQLTTAGTHSAVGQVRRPEGFVGGRRLAFPDQVRRLVALPVSAQIA